MDKNCRFFYQCPIFECVLFFIAQALVSPITRMVSTRFPGNEKFNFDFILWKETVLNLPMCETIYCFSIQHKSCDNNLLLVCFVTECLAVTIQEVFDPHQKAFLSPSFPSLPFTLKYIFSGSYIVFYRTQCMPENSIFSWEY